MFPKNHAAEARIVRMADGDNAAYCILPQYGSGKLLAVRSR